MATKQKQNSEAGWETAKWSGFVNIHMTDARVKAMDVWLEDDLCIWDMLGEIIGEGYKFSLSYNNSNDTYVASITGRYMRVANPGETLSIPHSDMNRAVEALVYVHLCEAGGGKWSEIGDILNENDW